MRNIMHEQYTLDDTIVDWIEFIFKAKIGGRRNTKDISISEGELRGIIRTYDNPTIPVRAVNRVDASIRYWIPPANYCHLVMDNACGHGSDDIIEKYVRMLKEIYNIKTIFQVPRSPYTNILDLGVWASLQEKIKKEHFGKRCEVNALTRSVLDTWNHDYLDDMITKFFKILRSVLVLIV